MTATDGLDVAVARAIKASLDAEGVDFDGGDDRQLERMRRAHDRLQRENPELMAQIRAWYLAKYRPPQDDPEFLRPDDIYLWMWLAQHDPWWELIDAPDAKLAAARAPAEDDDGDPGPPWVPQPWWDALDAQVGAALLAATDAEGIHAVETGNYGRSSAVLRRFAAEQPELIAALVERYSGLDDEKLEAADAEGMAIALWITEAAMNDPFVPRSEGTSR